MFCLIQCLTFTGLCKVLSLCHPFIGLCKVLTESMSYIHWPVQCSIRFSVLHSLACAIFYQIQCLTFIGLCNVLSDSMSYIRWPEQCSIRFSVLHSLACAIFYQIQYFTFIGRCNVLRFSVLHSLACAKFSSRRRSSCSWSLAVFFCSCSSAVCRSVHCSGIPGKGWPSLPFVLPKRLLPCTQHGFTSRFITVQ